MFFPRKDRAFRKADIALDTACDTAAIEIRSRVLRSFLCAADPVCFLANYGKSRIRVMIL